MRVWTSHQCEGCGKRFEGWLSSRRGAPRFCSIQCTAQSRRRPPCTCAHCGKTFIPKHHSRITYCSRECAFTAVKRAPSCPVYFPQCKQCNQVFTSKHGAKRICSLECVREMARLNQKYVPKPARTVVCVMCHVPFKTNHQGAARYCSPQCVKESEKEHKHELEHLRRRRKRDAYVKRVIRRRIYERDAWKCGICRRKVDPSLEVPHPLAKTIDHIVPISQGGTHEPRNVRLAHFICNSQRRDNVIAQLRLTD